MQINCDLGESYGRFRIGCDADLFPYLDACNIACGFHGGDPLEIERTIAQALQHDLTIGAHPSYPDLMGFGRRTMQIPADELRALIKYQVAALKGMTEAAGGKLAYVKPHGALYNTAARDPKEALAVVQAVRAIDSKLAVMGLAGSVLQEVALRESVPFIAEAFADRAYGADGRLVARNKAGAVLHDPAQAAAQVHTIAAQGQVQTIDGHWIKVQAQSMCIHGDNPSAVAILKAIQNLDL